MSACLAMSGTFAAIFSFEASKKWIIREGLNGISSSGSGAPIASGLRSEVAWVSHVGAERYPRMPLASQRRACRRCRG